MEMQPSVYPLLPDGSLDAGSLKMLKEVGIWMRRNGEAVYGSRAWTTPGEGAIVNGKLKMLPGGGLGKGMRNLPLRHRTFVSPLAKTTPFMRFVW